MTPCWKSFPDSVFLQKIIYKIAVNASKFKLLFQLCWFCQELMTTVKRKFIVCQKTIFCALEYTCRDVSFKIKCRTIVNCFDNKMVKDP